MRDLRTSKKISSKTCFLIPFDRVERFEFRGHRLEAPHEARLYEGREDSKHDEQSKDRNHHDEKLRVANGRESYGRSRG